ncbi:MAG TPA: hypothetical protein VMS31_18020 [Pyrinomonadaceae bacterium]|nr:hypothetical protein [Pyrinomonadaceae bacterium]
MKPFLGTWELASDRAVESITFELSGGLEGWWARNTPWLRLA